MRSTMIATYALGLLRFIVATQTDASEGMSEELLGKLRRNQTLLSPDFGYLRKMASDLNFTTGQYAQPDFDFLENWRSYRNPSRSNRVNYREASELFPIVEMADFYGHIDTPAMIFNIFTSHRIDGKYSEEFKEYFKDNIGVLTKYFEEIGCSRNFEFTNSPPTSKEDIIRDCQNYFKDDSYEPITNWLKNLKLESVVVISGNDDTVPPANANGEVHVSHLIITPAATHIPDWVVKKATIDCLYIGNSNTELLLKFNCKRVRNLFLNPLDSAIP
jgi:hypothetical protein